MPTSPPIVRLAENPDDRAAWSDAVEAYGALCWRIAVRMLGDPASADDAVQDTLLAVRSAAYRFRPGADAHGAGTAWVARIAVNTCHSHLRRRRRAPRPLPEGLSAMRTEEPGDALLVLRAELAKLPDALREAVELRYLADLEYEQVAAALGVAAGAARMRVSRGLERLRESLVRGGIGAPSVILIHPSAIPPVADPPAASVAAWKAQQLPAIRTIPSGASTMIASLVLAGAAAISVFVAEPAPLAPPTSAPAAEDVQPAPKPADASDPLRWLALRQEQNGSWTLDPTKASEADRTRATSFALLAYAGGGYAPYAGTLYAVNVERGLHWLLEHPPHATAPVVGVALRTMAICELHGMTARLRTEAGASLADLLARRTGAGWPETAEAGAIDTRTTAIAAVALLSASGAGVDSNASKQAMQEIAAWAEEAWDGRLGAGFPARTTLDGSPIGDATADTAGLIARLAIDRNATELEASWNPLIERGTLPPDPQDAAAHRDPTDVWLAPFASFLVGGPSWSRSRSSRAWLTTWVAESAGSEDAGGVALADMGMWIHRRYDLVQQVHLPVRPASQATSN